MQYLRQSLVAICICLYGFLAVTLGLSWLISRASLPPQADSYGFYRLDDNFEDSVFTARSAATASTGLNLPQVIHAEMP